MKRKLSVVLFMMALVGVCLAGCGSKDGSTSGKSKDTIAFSELFEEDVIVYEYFVKAGESFEGKDEKIKHVYTFNTDGTYHSQEIGNTVDNTLGGLTQLNNDELSELLKECSGKTDVYTNLAGHYTLGVKTDSTGNSVASEVILLRIEKSNNKDNDSFGFSERVITEFVGHTTIYDASYMVFNVYPEGYVDGTLTYLIKDTDKTKDKTVVFDSIDNSNVLVDVEAKDAFK